jgi:hypothetical protein
MESVAAPCRSYSGVAILTLFKKFVFTEPSFREMYTEELNGMYTFLTVHIVLKRSRVMKMNTHNRVPKL